MKRGALAWWNKTSIFGKTYLMSLMLTAAVVILGESSEYLASFGLAYWPATAEQLEVVIWLLAILIAGLAGGYIFSSLTTRPLKRLQAGVKELAGGNLEARLQGPDLQRSDEIGQLARGFNLMADNFKRTLDNEQRLMWDISHEMRSPLARLKVAQALLEKKTAPGSTAAAAEYLAQMDKDITRLDETAELLLARTRLETGQIIEKSHFDLARLIADSVRAFSFPDLDEGKNIACENTEKPLMIWGNRQGMRWVVDNLLKNALYYTAPHTTVNVGLKQSDREITLEITDQGPGMPEDHLPHIFRPFYRVDASRDRGSGGLGLGLSIARQMVDSHNGQIWAVNAGGTENRQGLKVVVTLPKN